MPERAAFYVDGFNLYHAVDELCEPHLKWLNLWKLGELLIPSRSQRLVRVVYCTALKTDTPEKTVRHRAYLRALEAVGVTCLRGHFIREATECRACSSVWEKPTEKETDVNLALSVIDDAHRDLFDHAYLLTSDSDQAATARLLKVRFPTKTLTTVSPPGRVHSKAILEHTPLKIALGRDHVARCLFDRAILPEGRVVVARPREYDPPR